jgi:hypothetical protein
MGKRTAGNQRHNHVEKAILLPKVQHRQDMRMMQLMRGACLAQKASLERGKFFSGYKIGREEYFDGYPVLGILRALGQKNNAHATPSQYFKQTIARYCTPR